MRAEVALFREVNVDLKIQENKLGLEYDQLIGSQTVIWDGKEVPLSFLGPVYEETDRSRREQAWRLSMNRKLHDRGTLNSLWVQFFDIRAKIAHNAGMKSYRDYMWQELLRFDYNPVDCARFHDSIEEHVVQPKPTPIIMPIRLLFATLRQGVMPPN